MMRRDRQRAVAQLTALQAAALAELSAAARQHDPQAFQRSACRVLTIAEAARVLLLQREDPVALLPPPRG